LNYGSFIKPAVCGMICIVIALGLIGVLMERWFWVWGSCLGGLAGFFSIWSYYEQGKAVFEHPEINKTRSAFGFRYLINGSFMALAAFLSLETLLIAFLCIYSVRWILFFSIRKL